jgi:hypothetical protein
VWFFLGVRIVCSSFFLSMWGISRDAYIGDYERRDRWLFANLVEGE